jgi:hypothetical protein
MKQNYKITLTPRAESKPIQSMNFRGTLWQANKAFEGLRIALHNSEFKKITLSLMGKNETGYPINVVVLTGAEYGL